MRDRLSEEVLLRDTGMKVYEKLTLRDDFMFGKVMQNKELCMTMLERLTGNHIEDIEIMEQQKSIRITDDSKGVRYDVYVEDNQDRVYDTEMQNGYNSDVIAELPKRARFYEGMIDLKLLESGDSYAELKDSYVIFICTFDPFGRGLSCYSFENVCNELPELKLEDGRKILFFNTKGNGEDISRETVEFLDYIETNKISGVFSDSLDKAVSKARMNREWRVDYMKMTLHDWDVRSAGIKQGKKEGMRHALADTIIEFLEEYGCIAEELRDRIYHEEKVDVLKQWVQLSARVSSIEEFIEKM